jgi:hypothetical protein
MHATGQELFEDDHGRPFARVLESLRSELVDPESVPELLEKLSSEAERYGSTREGDPTPALRLLAFDGLITELLGKQACGRGLGTGEFRRLQQILGSKSDRAADN